MTDEEAELIEAIDRARDRISAVIYTLEAGVDSANWERNCCIRFLYEALEALAIASQPAPAQSDAEPAVIKTTGYNMEGDGGPCMGLAQSDAEPIKWLPDANMRAELDRSELVARALLREIMKQIDCIEAEGNIEWHKRIKLNGELYLPDLAVAVLAVLYTAPPRPDASAGLIEAAERCTAEIIRNCIWPADSCTIEDNKITAIIVDALRACAADKRGK